MYFGKNYNSKPIQKRKGFNKTPDGISGLMSSVLARHNIGRQVNAAMIVQTADQILVSIVEEHMLPDVKVLSFKEGSLIVACRHPAAVHAMQSYCNTLKARIEEAMPAATIAVVQTRMHPEAWSEIYNG